MAGVHSEADRNSLHVRVIGESIEVGTASATASYLNIPAIVRAAQSVGADAVHPGIGFLSENPEFADAVEAAGLVFIGPRPETMRRFSDKWDAKREAMKAGVPITEGSQGSSSDAVTIEAQIRRMRLPALIKAVAGGGGRGVRVIDTFDGLRQAIESAMREAQSSFGRPDLLIEQFIDRPRHIEIQIAGDGHGGIIHLFERECSLQRRFQKIIEEAPAQGLSDQMRAKLIDAAVRLARQVNYRGLGTMEFLVAGDAHYFLECNPRLQVEHTVTEEITGLDLVEIQLRIAADGELPLTQEQVQVKGHAVQARVYAEDPAADFLPSTGQILAANFPHADVRVDSGVEDRSEVPPYYDALIAKLIAHGSDRAESLAKLKSAINNSAVLGLQSNLSFLSQLVTHPAVVEGIVDNRFIDRELASFQQKSVMSAEISAIACEVWLNACQPEVVEDPWTGHNSWCLSDGLDRPGKCPAFLLRHGNERHAITLGRSGRQGWTRLAIDAHEIILRLEKEEGTIVRAVLPDKSVLCRAVVLNNTIYLHGQFGAERFDIEPYLANGIDSDQASGRLLAPMMGSIVKVNVMVGDRVKAAEQLIVLESMKMEYSINAPFDGIIMSLSCSPRDMVERNAQVATIEPLQSPHN